MSGRRRTERRAHHGARSHDPAIMTRVSIKSQTLNTQRHPVPWSNFSVKTHKRKNR